MVMPNTKIDHNVDEHVINVVVTLNENSEGNGDIQDKDNIVLTNKVYKTNQNNDRNLHCKEHSLHSFTGFH